ncbi:MAG: beta strand repeat-containing protein, partial [Gammaproteobacteria bacterium]
MQLLATRVIVGSGVGGQSQVRVFDGQDVLPPATPLLSFAAFTQNAGGEVRVAGCDFNNDGINEIIAGTGLGTRAEVRVFHGVTGALLGSPFLAFESGFLGGVHLACGDVTGTAVPEIIAARGALAKPEVRVFGFDGVSAVQVRSFNAFEQNFFGGVRLAACDLNGDSKTEIIAARGPLGQPQIRTFDGATGTLLGSFLAFNAGFRGGVYVACGKISGDTIPDFIATRGGLDRPEVRVFDGTNPTLVLRSFDAFNSSFLGGVRVAACDLNQDGTSDILAGRGPGAQPEVRAFNGLTGGAFPAPLGSFPAFGTSFKGGVYVACSPNASGGGGPPPVDTAPEVTSTIPSNGATGVTTDSNLTIAFNEAVNVAGDWFQLVCPTSGTRNVTNANTVVTGGPTTWTINPNVDFAPNEICTTTIVATQITDVDTSDPPDTMAADFTFSFTTDAAPTVQSTVPTNGATGVAVDTDVTVNFSESVAIPATPPTFALECPAGTPVSFTVTPPPPATGNSFTLNPDSDLPAGSCTVKVTAAQVTDVDTNDPPDLMVADFISTFSTGANNPPSFVVGLNQTVAENAGPQTVSPWATAIDDGDPSVTQALTFNVTGNTLPSLFSAGPSVDATGVLTYTPATNQSGTASITLTLSDDGGTPGTPTDDATSPPQSFTITVNAVNNAPTFVAGPNQSVNEDAGSQTVSPWATAIDDGDPESTQTVSFIITNNTAPSLFSVGPSVSPSGVLSYTPAANAFGSATITLVLQDDGGTANPGDDDTSDPQSFTITINAVNDPPAFNAGPNQTVLEDAGLVTVSPWATAITAGPGESGQILTFQVSNNNAALFTVQPAVSSSGVLTFTPAPNANGSATVMVTLQDSGGTANGGVDTFGPLGFTITVTPVNDPPSVTPPAAYAAHAHIAINIPDGASDLFDGSTITDVDGPGAAPFSLTAAGPFASAGGGSVTIAANGSFSYNPPVGSTGANDTFLYQICDSGVPGSACTNATATVTVSGPRVWFVDNALGSAGDGRLSAPFNTLGQADTAANANGDRIFVFTGASTYTGFGLLSNQRLIGQGVVDTNFDTALGITPPATSVARPAINGTRPTITGTITLATGATVRGLNIVTTAVIGLTGSAVTGVTVNDASVSATNATAVNVDGGGAFTLTRVDSSNAAKGIILNNNPAGSFTVTGTGTTDGSGGTITDSGSTMTRGIELMNAQNISLSNMTLTNANRVDGAASNGTFGGNENTDEHGAIHLQGVTNVSLTNVDINGTVQHGINGNVVTNLDITNCVIQNTGLTGVINTTIFESGIYIFNLRGTAAAGNDNVFSNTTVRDSGQFNIFVQNNGSTNAHSGSTNYAGVNRPNMDALTMNSMTFADSGNVTIGDHVTVFNVNNGVNVANFRTVVTNSTFTSRVGTGVGSDYAGVHTSDGIQVDASGTAHSDFEISGSTIGGAPGQSAINVSAAGTGFATLNVHDNPSLSVRAGVGINVAINGDSEVRGFIQDNPNIFTVVGN